MTRQALTVFACAATLGGAVVAACSGFSSEETLASNDAGDAQTGDAGVTLESDAQLTPTDAGSDSGSRTIYGPYDFENGLIPKDWGTLVTNTAERQVTITSDRHFGDGGFSLFASAGVNAIGHPGQQAFLRKPLENVGSLEMHSKLWVNKRCADSTQCSLLAAISVLTADGIPFSIWLTSVGFTLAGDGKTMTGLMPTDQQWIDATYLLSRTANETTVTAKFGDFAATLTATRDASTVTTNVSVDIGIQTGLISMSGAGWNYYLDDLQITTTP